MSYFPLFFQFLTSNWFKINERIHLKHDYTQIFAQCSKIYVFSKYVNVVLFRDNFVTYFEICLISRCHISGSYCNSLNFKPGIVDFKNPLYCDYLVKRGFENPLHRDFTVYIFVRTVDCEKNISCLKWKPNLNTPICLLLTSLLKTSWSFSSV
jgi:hypothetical protein